MYQETKYSTDFSPKERKDNSQERGADEVDSVLDAQEAVDSLLEGILTTGPAEVVTEAAKRALMPVEQEGGPEDERHRVEKALLAEGFDPGEVHQILASTQEVGDDPMFGGTFEKKWMIEKKADGSFDITCTMRGAENDDVEMVEQKNEELEVSSSVETFVKPKTIDDFEDREREVAESLEDRRGIEKEHADGAGMQEKQSAPPTSDDGIAMAA